MFQEGFGLLSSPRLRGRGAGWDVVLPKASGLTSYATGPECAISHAAFVMINIIQAHWHMLTLGSLFHIYWSLLCTDSIEAYIVLKQKWMYFTH